MRAHMHLYLLACGRMHLYLCVSLRAFTRINANVVVCVRACTRASLIKTQNAFARKKIAKLKCTLGSETFRMYYI